VSSAKQELRRSLRGVRDSISATARASASEAAARHLLALPIIATARTVSVYSPVRGEIDPGAAVRVLAARGVRLVYPRVVADEHRLEFHELAPSSEGTLDPAAVRAGSFGILEPLPSAPIVAPEHIDVFLVPGLGFDETGSRLGWGRGYYDRTLARVPSAIRIGYCYACQIVPHVPHHHDDLPMHYLVTEAGARASRPHGD
jgi:5-formyltetrahydrofolate cyclo-ligase